MLNLTVNATGYRQPVTFSLRTHAFNRNPVVVFDFAFRNSGSNGELKGFDIIQIASTKKQKSATRQSSLFTQLHFLTENSNPIYSFTNSAFVLISTSSLNTAPGVAVPMAKSERLIAPVTLKPAMVFLV